MAHIVYGIYGYTVDIVCGVINRPGRPFKGSIGKELIVFLRLNVRSASDTTLKALACAACQAGLVAG